MASPQIDIPNTKHCYSGPVCINTYVQSKENATSFLRRCYPYQNMGVIYQNTIIFKNKASPIEFSFVYTHDHIKVLKKYNLPTKTLVNVKDACQNMRRTDYDENLPTKIHECDVVSLHRGSVTKISLPPNNEESCFFCMLFS